MRFLLFALALAAACTVPHEGLQPISRFDGGADAPPIDGCVPSPETCDGNDEDCDGRTDEDADEVCSGVARGICTPGRRVCSGGLLGTFCEGEILPGPRELCNGTGDEDCDGSVDEDCPCTNGMVMACRLDLDVGECRSGNSTCVDGMRGACEGIQEPVAEICNGLDDDCDGTPDNGVLSAFYPDGDEDGFGVEPAIMACMQPSGHASSSGDCDDTREDRTPGRPETCDEVDNDCDTRVDEGAAMVTYYVDSDLDGFGDPRTAMMGCSAPAGSVTNGNDCDDTSFARKPGAPESCNGFDDNCDGQVDETSCEACTRGVFGGHTYLFCGFDFEWEVARGPAIGPGGIPLGCRSFGYDLVQIDDSAENTWLFANAPGDQEWWIGLRRNGTTYTWVDGTTILYSGAPIRSGSGDGCFTLDDEGGTRGDWPVRDCDGSSQDSHAFICEVPR